MKKVLSVLLVLIILLGSGGYLLATKADASTPLDSLYTVDLFAEAVQRTFTFGDIAQAEFEQAILDERSEELETLIEEETEESVLGEAIGELEDQRLRVEKKVQVLLNDEGNYDEAAIERIRTRYEEQLQNQLQNMEMVREKFEQKTFTNETAQENFQKAIANFENAQQNFQDAMQKMNDARSNGNTEQNVDDDAGDGVNNNESNSDESTGNGR